MVDSTARVRDHGFSAVIAFAALLPAGGHQAELAHHRGGTRLEGTDPRGWAEGSLGFGVDKAAFVRPDGSRLPTRLTGVLREENGEWKVVHLHFSVGAPDNEAVVLGGKE